MRLLPRHTASRHRFPRSLIAAGALAAVVLVAAALGYAYAFGPKDVRDASPREFIVSPGESAADVADALAVQGFVRYRFAFAFARLAARSGPPRAGGYQLSPAMDAWTVATTLAQAPYLAWVVIPNGLRREQIADLLASTFGWDEEEQAAWLDARSVSPDFPEGVYYAGTYLIPSDASPASIAARMRSKFQDVFAPYASEAAARGLAWKDVITLASLIEREAAKNDKALVAGILANRLARGMSLQVDATLQYIIGSEENHWWPAPSASDKRIESPFNTYLHRGLPPAPIASPSVESIAAAMSPATTSCLYYLHDGDGVIHCAPTYADHLANVKRYLR